MFYYKVSEYVFVFFFFRFPTMYWVPKDNKPKKYEGGREVDNFIDFIKKESSFDSVNVSGETKKKKKAKKGKKTEL